MKVILTEDVKALGKKGQVVDVSDGYARNFLLKTGKGLEANAKNMNDLKLQKATADRRAQKELEAAQELAKKLEAAEVELAIKTGESGKAFGSVSSKEISATLKEQAGLEVDKKKFQMKETLKTIGTHQVTVKLHAKVTAQLKVTIKEA